MFRFLVVVTVLFITTEAQYIFPTKFPELLWVSPRITNNNLVQVPLGGKFPSVCLTNVENVFYYGAISIGSPQKIFKVIFDTVSIHLRINFIESENPFGRPRSHYKISYKQYVTNDTSFHVQFLPYCNVKGFQSTENVERTSIYNLYLNIHNLEYGVFGLSDYQTDDGIRSVFDNMIRQGLVSSRIFSLYLNRNVSAKLGGKLIFGGSDPAYYEGDFTYIPVSDKGRWILPIDSIEVKGAKSYKFISCDGSCVANIETSVWKIMGPRKDVSLINRLIGADSYGNLNCSRIPHLPIITFNLGGKAFHLTGKDYLIRHPDDEGICVTVFRQLDLGRYVGIQWILGIPFMGRFYTEFDMEKNRVGFALARNV